MKTDLIIKDEGPFWGLNVRSLSVASEIFTVNYFKGLSKKRYYIPSKDKNYFVALALSCGLVITTESELSNHSDNLERILWIAAGDIMDETRK